MSRYRKTMREALEEIRGKVKEQQNLKEDGHTDVVSAKRQCSTIMEDARDISNKLGSLSPEDGLPSWWMNKLAVSSNSMNKLRDFFIHSEARQLKDPKKEMMVVKDGKVKVIDKTEFDKYKSKGYIQAEELEEGKMKDIFSMQQDGASVKDIAKKMGLDVQTVKDILGEESEETLKEFNPDFGKDASASRTKTSGEKDKVIKDDKDKDKEIQSLKNDIAMLKTKLENEKNKAVKPEPNPKTGEVPLTVGVAYKHFKDKEEKVKTEEIEIPEIEIDENFSPAMVDKLKKAYAPLKGKRIPPEPLMKIFDKIDKNIPGLVQLYRADIPFVSTMAMSRLMLKHGLKPADIKKLKEETEITEYFATVHSKRPEIAKFINANKKGIDYVDDDAGGNIEFEGKNAHELADKVKAKFGVRVTKENYEPLSETLPSMTKPMTVQYTYTRNPDLFDKTLAGTKTGKKMKNVGPKLKGVYVLKAPGQDHINFLQTLNSKGIMPKNKILGEEQKFEGAKNLVNKILGERK